MFSENVSTGVKSILKVSGDGFSKSLNLLGDGFFGNVKDNVAVLFNDLENLSTTLKVDLKGVFSSFPSSLDDLKDRASKIFETIDSNEFASGLSDVAGSIASVTGNLLQQGLVIGLEGFFSLAAKLFEFSMVEGQVDKLVDFIDTFAEELPEAAPAFVERLLENADNLIGAIAGATPAIVDTLVEQLPRVIEGLADILGAELPRIAISIAEGLPVLIKGLIPALFKLFKSLLKSLPVLIGGIIESIPVLIGELLKALLSPSFWIAVVVAIGTALVQAVKGLFKGIGSVLGVFHDGGVIPGNSTDVPIIAQSGEGVLSRRGLKALGGESVLNNLNGGKNPYFNLSRFEGLKQFHDGGIVGGSNSFSSTPITSSNSVNNQNNVSNSFVINPPTFERNDDEQDVKRKTEIYLNEIELGLAKRVKNRESVLYDSFN